MNGLFFVAVEDGGGVYAFALAADGSAELVSTDRPRSRGRHEPRLRLRPRSARGPCATTAAAASRRRSPSTAPTSPASSTSLGRRAWKTSTTRASPRRRPRCRRTASARCGGSRTDVRLGALKVGTLPGAVDDEGPGEGEDPGPGEGDGPGGGGGPGEGAGNQPGPVDRPAPRIRTRRGKQGRCHRRPVGCRPRRSRHDHARRTARWRRRRGLDVLRPGVPRRRRAERPGSDHRDDPDGCHGRSAPSRGVLRRW